MRINSRLLPEFFKDRWNKSRTGFASLALPFFLLSLLFLCFFRGDVISVLDDWKLIPRPETFTELYFVDYDDIDHSAPETGKQIDFLFAISNREGVSKDYEYEVYLEAEGEKNIIEHNSIHIEKDEVAFIEERYVFTKSYKKGSIIVQILEPNQSIHILLDK